MVDVQTISVVIAAINEYIIFIKGLLDRYSYLLVELFIKGNAPCKSFHRIRQKSST